MQLTLTTVNQYSGLTTDFHIASMTGLCVYWNLNIADSWVHFTLLTEYIYYSAPFRVSLIRSSRKVLPVLNIFSVRSGV